MSFEISEKNNIVLIKLGVNFDRHLSVDLKSKIEDLKSKNKLNLLFNLSETKFLDSAGLGLLVSASKMLKKDGGHVKICSITSNVKNLFELTRLNQYFEIFQNVDEAIESFQ